MVLAVVRLVVTWEAWSSCGKCAACENGERDVHADRLGVSRQLVSLQVGRAQRMGLFVGGMADSLFAVRELAREIANVLMMLTGRE